MRIRRRIVLCRALFALLVCGLGGSLSHAQPTRSKDKDPKPTSAIKLPSGAIIIVTNDVDSIDQAASVYLTPAQYKELSDQIESLKKQIAAEKPTAPSSCEISGAIEQRGAQSIVSLQAVFHFRTSQARSVVYLGCQKTQLVKAKLDDAKLPLLASGEKGLSALVEDAGEHVLRLDLETGLLPRGPKSTEIGFEIGLPGAAITLLSFATPPKVQRMTISRREVGSAPLLPNAPVEGPLEVKRIDADLLQPGRAKEALGPITYLALSWEDESRVVGGTAVRSVETDLQITVSDADIAAEARMRLKGPAREWRFIAPSNAEVSVGRPPATAGGKIVDFPIDLAPEIIRPEPGQSIWRIRFREIYSSELLAVISTKTPRNRADPKAKSLWPVGPFAVLDVPQQSGAIRVKVPPHIRVTPERKGDTQRIDASDEPGAELFFRYRSLPMGPNNQPAPPLELDIRTAAGVVQTRVHHYLQMADGGWRLRSEFAVVPIRMEVESLDIDVPSSVTFDAATPKLVESISPLHESGPQRRVVQVKLAAAQRGEFTFALEGFYPTPAGTQESTVVLPRVLGAFDRQGQVTATPLEGYDLRGNLYQWETDKPGTLPHPLEPATTMEKSNALSAGVGRTASTVELLWKPQRSDVRVESQVEITLGDHQGLVAQTLKYKFADRLPKLRVRASAAVTGLAVTPGSLESNGPLDWYIVPPAGELGKEATLVLNYGFALPANAGEDSTALNVPLLWPDGVTWCDTRVHVWRDRQASRPMVPSVSGDAWEERPPELLANESSIPLLVLRGTGINLPLGLRLTEPGRDSAAATTVWVDRILIQAQNAGANQQYRVRFHLSKWSARSLELELPAGATEVEVSVNGNRVESLDRRADGEGSRTIRISLLAIRDQSQALVELRYQLPGGHREGIAGLVAVWQPPRLLGRSAVAAIRWQVAVPPNSVPLALGESTFDERWAVRNGMAQALPAFTSGDLEKWISSGREPDGSETAAGWEIVDGITARPQGLTSFRVAIVPRLAFIVTITLLTLAAGLLLARLPKRAVGVLLSLIAAGAITVGFLWPQPTGQVLSAAQPGFALLALILGSQRVLQWRYRRRLSRLPGFTRVRTESALARSNGRPLRETSTIDSPAPSRASK